MNRLALTLRPAALETPTSFLSRLAARNGCPDMVSFCYDLGLDLIAISNGEGSSIEDLCHVAGLPKDAFAKTAVIKTTKMGYRIGEETFESLTLNRVSVRVCPECLREQHRELPELWGKVHQLHWQIPQIERCYLHNECLLTISEKSELLQRFDASFAIKNAWSYIRHVERPMTADSFDHYLSKRLNRHRSQTLCDRLSIPALWRIAEALGITLKYERSRRRSRLSCEAQRQALLTGFELIEAGETAVVEALTGHFKKDMGRASKRSVPQYGELQRVLQRKIDYSDQFEPFRDLMRRYVLDRHPLEAGTVVFGVKVERRRVHSINSAMHHLKVRRDVFEEILIDQNLGHRNEDGVFELDKVLSVETVEELRPLKSRFLSKQEAAKFLGASETVFKELQKSKVLQPRTGRTHRVHKGYDAVYLQRVLDQIFEGTRVFRTVPEDLQTLPNVTRQAQCSAPDVVQLILSGRLQAKGRLGEQFKLNNLLVSKEEVFQAFPQQSRNGFTKGELCKRWSMSLPAINRLIDSGILHQKRMKHSHSRVTGMLVLVEDVDAYERERLKNIDEVSIQTVD